MDRGAYHYEFMRRLEAIPAHGLGLSVDVHSPPLASLRQNLRDRGVPPSYLEVFRTTTTALESVKKDVDNGPIAYHGEGLWVTQPGMTEMGDFQKAFHETVEHLLVLQSAWLNHECAAKFLAGHYFGTYLPPLYTKSSADMVSEHVRQIQRLLDQRCGLANGNTPLLLLEMPPLTYFVAGTLSLPGFFKTVCDQSPCGLVLDIGHLWTVFRYSWARQTQSRAQFVSTFLDEFPLERVVEIHIAGLNVHDSSGSPVSISSGHSSEAVLPAWIDAHEAPIPAVLFEMLDQILSLPRLTNLKGLALEVDMKPAELIVEEFTRFSQRYKSAFPRIPMSHVPPFGPEGSALPEEQSATTTKQVLQAGYDRYVCVLTGKAEPAGPEWEEASAYAEELDRYRTEYLPHEILHWGGDVEDMFVESCRQLRERGLLLERFVSFWFREPRCPSGSYDFFLLKVERFVEFVCEIAPDLQDMVDREASELRRSYQLVNEPTVPAEL
ncbi:MAG: DUF692 family protein [Nitrospira sp.]|nr:DUF692 family protein [Nitrospira sp.]